MSRCLAQSSRLPGGGRRLAGAAVGEGAGFDRARAFYRPRPSFINSPRGKLARRPLNWARTCPPRAAYLRVGESPTGAPRSRGEISAAAAFGGKLGGRVIAGQTEADCRGLSWTGLLGQVGSTFRWAGVAGG